MTAMAQGGSPPRGRRDIKAGQRVALRALEMLLVSGQYFNLTITYEEAHMNTRLCAVIGAVALVFAIGSASAFACGAGHHSARSSTPTKVSYVSPSTSVRQTATK
jgi:hypothetical protein